MPIAASGEDGNWNCDDEDEDDDVEEDGTTCAAQGNWIKDASIATVAFAQLALTWSLVLVLAFAIEIGIMLLLRLVLSFSLSKLM